MKIELPSLDPVDANPMFVGEKEEVDIQRKVSARIRNADVEHALAKKRYSTNF